MTERPDYVPPTDRALELVRGELVPIVGEDCADAILLRCAVFGILSATQDRPEVAAALLQLRTLSAVRDDVQQVARLASRLGKLLAKKDTCFVIDAERVRSSGAVVPGPLLGGQAHRTERLGLELATLGEAADKAAKRLQGQAVVDLRAAFLHYLAGALAMFGHPVATGEQSRMVRVARIVWPLLPFVGDPRDAWRRHVKAHDLDLRRHPFRSRDASATAPEDADLGFFALAVSFARDLGYVPTRAGGAGGVAPAD